MQIFSSVYKVLYTFSRSPTHKTVIQVLNFRIYTKMLRFLPEQESTLGKSNNTLSTI